jgi:hypothetical protein
MGRTVSTWRQYDSEAMAHDAAEAIGDMWGVEIGEIFSRAAEPGLGSHAFNIVTPSDRKFLVTFTEVESE